MGVRLMASTLTEVRNEVAAALASVGVDVYPLLPASPQLPCVVVMFPDSIDFDKTLSGLASYDMKVSVFVPLTDVDAAQTSLDGLVTGGIKQLLESHSSTVWRALHVASVNNFRPESFGDAAALAADLNFTLFA
jgi:hypothetical protein